MTAKESLEKNGIWKLIPDDKLEKRVLIKFAEQYAKQEKIELIEKLIEINGTRYLKGWDVKYYKWMNGELFKELKTLKNG